MTLIVAYQFPQLITWSEIMGWSELILFEKSTQWKALHNHGFSCTLSIACLGVVCVSMSLRSISRNPRLGTAQWRAGVRTLVLRQSSQCSLDFYLLDHLWGSSETILLAMIYQFVNYIYFLSHVENKCTKNKKNNENNDNLWQWKNHEPPIDYHWKVSTA